MAYMYKKKECEFWPITLEAKGDGIDPVPTKRDDVLKIPDERVFASGTPGGWMHVMVSEGSGAGVKKWGVLRGDFLFFFKDEKSGNPTAVVPLRECSKVEELPRVSDSDPCHLRFSFNDDAQYSPISVGFALAEVAAEWRKEINDRLSHSHRHASRSKKDEPPSKDRFPHGWPTKGLLIVSHTKLLGKAQPPAKAQPTPQPAAAPEPLSPPPPPPPQPEPAAAATKKSPKSVAIVEVHLKEAERRGLQKEGWNPDLHANSLDKMARRLTMFQDREKLARDRETRLRELLAASAWVEMCEKEEAASGAGGGRGGGRASGRGGAAGGPGSQPDPPSPSPSMQSYNNNNNINYNSNNNNGGTPMTLAEQLRVLLFFDGTELVEDPQPEAATQIPHLKGDLAENMIVGIYQHYAALNLKHGDIFSSSQNGGVSRGFMSLEEWIVFVDHLGVQHTHSPRGENDEVVNKDIALQLDAVRLLLSVSTASGTNTLVQGEADIKSAMRYTAALDKDPFIIDFAKFYQLIIRISQVVYKSLYHQDPTVTLNKLMHETVCPLFAWIQNGHNKSGCRDPLLLEERVPLLLHTYAPNLWKVFLAYAQDCNRKPPALALRFPYCAQVSERLFFCSGTTASGQPLRLPAGAPTSFPIPPCAAAPAAPDSALFLTETKCLQLLRDYGLLPGLVTKETARALFRSLRARPRASQAVRTSTKMANVPDVADMVRPSFCPSVCLLVCLFVCLSLMLLCSALSLPCFALFSPYQTDSLTQSPLSFSRFPFFSPSPAPPCPARSRASPSPRSKAAAARPPPLPRATATQARAASSTTTTMTMPRPRLACLQPLLPLPLLPLLRPRSHQCGMPETPPLAPPRPTGAGLALALALGLGLGLGLALELALAARAGWASVSFLS